MHRCQAISTASILALLFTVGHVSAAYIWEYNPSTDNWYALTESHSNWLDAENEAIALGGHLVAINSVAENTWLTNTFDAYSQAFPGNASHNIAWIGYSLNSGSWQWTSGETVTYTNYFSGWSSYNGSHAYLHLAKHPSPSTWNRNSLHDIDSDYYARGIIELDSNPVPEPTSFAMLAGLGVMGLIAVRRRRRVA